MYCGNLIVDKLLNAAFSDIRLIATDMDGTLTQAGKFTPALLQALTDLTAADKVIVTTGRSAGWVSGLAAYLSVDGAIALLLSVSLE